MSTRHPVVFISHGAPDLLLNPGATGELWSALGRRLPRPKAILVVSAHWEANRTLVSAAAAPETMHDFGGFPRALYAMHYPAPGAVQLAGRVAALLGTGGLDVDEDVQMDQRRGLDHGAWVPLTLMYPEADIPVSQLAVQPRSGPAWHRELGRLLQPLRDEGVLILASGAITHNFGWLRQPGSPPFPPAVEFATWFGQTLTEGEDEALLDYRHRAPHGAAAHPTEEHLLPFFVAWGASGPGDRVTRLAPEYTYGGLAMDAYLWESGTGPGWAESMAG